MGKCKVVSRFYCVYMVASVVDDIPEFHVGHVCVSCEHCLTGFLSGLGGEVIYKRRYRFLPEWEHVEPHFQKTGDAWLERQARL